MNVAETHNAWYRCPKCGTEGGHREMPNYVKLPPPVCAMGHAPREMEQTIQEVKA